MGSKNQDNAEASKNTLSKKSGDPVPDKKKGNQPCDKQDKHWIGVRVEDEDGNLVKDVTVHLKLPGDNELDVDMGSAKLEKDGSYHTKKIYDAGTCEFSFPEMINLEWWPKGGAAGAATANGTATVADGDCTVSIAEALKFRDYHSIWDRSENNNLKKDRPTPNHLTKDDALSTPDEKDKVEKKAMDQVWIFVVKNRKPAKLRIVLTDKDGKPLGGKKWDLKTPVADSGTTGNDGLVEVKELPGKYKDASVEVTLKDAAKPPKKSLPPKTPDPPPYPLNIIPDDFKDKNEKLDFGKQLVKVEVKIGSLEAFNRKPGVLARLHNLGFCCDIDSDDPRIEKGVKAYQRFFMKNKNGSGKPEDIQDDARTRHDKA